MALTATIFSHDPTERRGSDRRAIARTSTMRDEGARPYAVLVEDLSVDGFSMIAGVQLGIDSTISIGLPGVGRRNARVVRVVDNRYGCRFDEPLSPQALAAAFAGDPVVSGGFAPLPPALDLSHEPQLAKWPRAVRLVLLVGASALLWTALLRLI